MHIMIYSVLNLGFGGGFEKWVAEVAPRLVERGHEVHVVTTSAGDVKNACTKMELITRGVRVTELSHFSVFLTLPRLYGIRRLLEMAENFDIIYFNNAFAGNELLLSAIKRLTNVKVIAGYRGIFPNVGSRLRQLYYQTINKEVSRSFDAHHVVNREREKLLRLFGYKNVYYIPNGVDIFKFKPGQKREVFTVLFVGRLDYQKGVDTLARLATYCNKYNEKDVHFLIAGRGPQSHIVKNLQTMYRNVKWLGYVSNAELVRLYQWAHVLVAPSRFEEFLFTSIEAQACGTPVIASDIPGPRDNIIHGHTGFLIRPSVEEFAKYILFLKNLWQNSRKHYEQYSQNARKNALNYDWSIVVDRLEKMFVEVSKL